MFGADFHRAEVHRAEVHRAEVHRAEVHRAEVHRAEVHRAEVSIFSPGREVYPQNPLQGSDNMMHSSITQDCVRLCMRRGTRIDAGHGNCRYYYKCLCVLTHSESGTSPEDIVTAFWTPQAYNGCRTFKEMLKDKTPFQIVRHPRKSRLLMLRS